ncbi:MAG TPA: hypothetical protein VMA37_11965 [Acetobacteraceae bacterium]|nr:hypothetical protein [Acetobacteraceae bacterium]
MRQAFGELADWHLYSRKTAARRPAGGTPPPSTQSSSRLNLVFASKAPISRMDRLTV